MMVGTSFCVSQRSRKANLCRNLPKKCQTPIPGIAFCASLRSRNAHRQVARASLCSNLPKNAGPCTAFCASLHSRNAHGHFTRASLYGNFQERCQTPIPRPMFYAGLQSRNYMDISQESCCISRQKCRTPVPRPMFSASPRNRNARGYFTRDMLYGNLQA